MIATKLGGVVETAAALNTPLTSALGERRFIPDGQIRLLKMGMKI
jgi:hypothetical protein